MKAIILSREGGISRGELLEICRKCSLEDSETELLDGILNKWVELFDSGGGLGEKKKTLLEAGLRQFPQRRRLKILKALFNVDLCLLGLPSGCE